MKSEMFGREKSYEAAMAVLRSMYEAGLLTDSELAGADAELRGKYRPVFGSLRPLNP
jgi:pentatricopeptide repeat protein